MLYPAVNWHEGLFLQPHHFQAWDRHWREQVTAVQQWQNPYSYGLARIAINLAALAAGYFQVDSLKAKTPGGALIEMSDGQQSERRDLRPAMERRGSSSSDRHSSELVRETSIDSVDVYVGIPRLRLGAKNVEAQESSAVRFKSELMELPDEQDASSVQPVEVRRINARILLADQDMAGYDALPIARVIRAMDGAAFEIDRRYIPPLLDCAAWPGLISEILSPLSDLMLRFSEQAGQAISEAGAVLQANSSIELQRLLLLQTVNPAASMLRVMATSLGVHPQMAYLELSRLAGAIDIFHPRRSAIPTRAYDHDALGPLFYELYQRITESLAGLTVKPYRQRYFKGTASGMQTEVNAESIAACRQWFVGVDKGILPRETLFQLLSPGQLDWKLGSTQQVEWLFTKRSPGVELVPVTDVPVSLPKGSEWSYFRVVQDSPAWRDVMATGSLAMRWKDALIVNRENLPGSRQLVVRHDQRDIELRFALFGVS